MQVKLWPANEKSLREVAAHEDYARVGVSVSKLANLFIAEHIIAINTNVKKPKKK